MNKDSKTKSTIYIVTLFTLFSLAVSFFYLQSIADNQRSDWLEYSENEIKRSELLQEIITNIGFGGFIHNYKNSILRKDSSALNKASLQVNNARKLISDYRSIYPVDNEFLLNVDAVLFEYSENITLIRSLSELGLSAEAIDGQVRVDDSTALYSIAALITENGSIYNKIAKKSKEREFEFKFYLYCIFIFVLTVLIASLAYIMSMVNKNTFQYRQMSILFDLAPLSILAVGEDGYITSANKVAIDTFGMDKDHLCEINIDQLTPGSISKEHKQYREEFQRSDRTIPMSQRGGKFNAQRLNGEIFPANISIATYSHHGMKEAIVVIKDITDDIKQLRDANFDPLTQLPNRRSIDKFLSEAILRSKRQGSNLYVALIDIDYFKRINDKFGHSFGDAVLADLGGYLQQSIRETDFIGRWGGEEFLLILEDTTAEGALNVCENVRELISEQSKLKGYQYTVSIGCTKYLKETDETVLFDNADIALYVSKKDGRNRTTIM
jgi:diguanylate cyclase (GGDEF)-like protein/PAS domain S-box-containing protein